MLHFLKRSQIYSKKTMFKMPSILTTCLKKLTFGFTKFLDLKVPVPTLKFCCLSETTLFRHFTVVCFRGEFQEVFCFVLKPNSVFEIYVVLLLLLHSVCIIYEVFFPQIIYGFLAIYKDKKPLFKRVFFFKNVIVLIHTYSIYYLFSNFHKHN